MWVLFPSILWPSEKYIQDKYDTSIISRYMLLILTRVYFFHRVIYIYNKMRLIKKPLLNVLNEHLIDYPTPTTINYM